MTQPNPNSLPGFSYEEALAMISQARTVAPPGSTAPAVQPFTGYAQLPPAAYDLPPAPIQTPNNPAGVSEPIVEELRRSGRGKLVISAVAAMAIVGGIAAYKYGPDGFTSSNASSRPAKTTEQLAPSSASAHASTHASPKPSASASSSPKPLKALASFTPEAVNCAPITSVTVNADVPLMQSIILKGDPTRYDFSDGPNADFVVAVRGSIGYVACLNPSDLKLDSKTSTASTKTYNVAMGGIALQPDTTKLRLTPMAKDNDQVLADLCTTQEQVAKAAAPAKKKLTATTNPGQTPPACQQAAAYKPGQNSEILNEVQASLTSEALSVDQATTTMILKQIDTQYAAGQFTQALQNYVRTSFTEQSVTQQKQQQAAQAPELSFNFTGQWPPLGHNYAVQHLQSAQLLASKLIPALQSKLHSTASSSLTYLLETFHKLSPTALLPTAGVDDNTSDFTPVYTIKQS